MKPTRLAASCAALLALSAGCAGRPAATPAPAAATAIAAPAATPPANLGLDLAGMDRSVAPGDDFFRYANGTWLRGAEIPADRSAWGPSAVLAEQTSKRIADLIAEAAKAPHAPGSDEQKVADTYASFLDEAAIEARGLEPVKPALAAIERIGDLDALSRALGGTVRADVDVMNNTNFHTPNLLGLWVAQDLDDPSKYAPFLLQGGLELPDRDYYLDPSPHMAEIRAKYREHVAAVLKLAGFSDPAGKAAHVLALETRIAQAHADRTESEDVLKGNNHWTRAELDAKAPGIRWDAFLAPLGLERQPVFVVWQPRALAALSALVASQPLSDWKEWLAFHELEAFSYVLPKAFADERFAFYGKALSGTPQQSDRWKRAVAVTDASLGEAVGRLYVTHWFPASAKARIEEMVRNEIAAFGKRIDALDWMAPKTKETAKAKLAVLKVGVGYPDRWRDYSGLVVKAGDAYGNADRAARFELARNLAKLGKPVDRGEWVMNPQLVNAVNLPAMNALNFPAAILQAPNFDPTRPVVSDYGAIGSVIGHEISHSFDDQGAQFDATGKLRDWWTPEDLAHFKAAAEQLAKQYDAYRPFPDVHVNGRLTLSENLADLAGLAAAYDAYHMAYGGREAPTVQGLTGDQQFFVAFAQGWRAKFREAALRVRLVTDSHAPAEYRADTVRNVDPWYAAFGVKEGKLALAPKDRVRVW